MKEALTSMTKAVLLLFSLAFIIGLFIWKIDSKDFVNIMLMVVSFYFWAKTNNINNGQ